MGAIEDCGVRICCVDALEAATREVATLSDSLKLARDELDAARDEINDLRFDRDAANSETLKARADAQALDIECGRLRALLTIRKGTGNERMHGRPIYYMAHPVSGDVSANIANAKWWLKYLLLSFPNIDFTAPWIPWVEALSDASEEHRARGLAFDCESVRQCDAIVLVGPNVSPGMYREAEAARHAGIKVFDWTGWTHESIVALEGARLLKPRLEILLAGVIAPNPSDVSPEDKKNRVLPVTLELTPWDE